MGNIYAVAGSIPNDVFRGFSTVLIPPVAL
jgi:hypothetical protein